MRYRTLAIVIIAGISLPWAAAAKDKKPTGPVPPIGWLALQADGTSLSVSESALKKGERNLARGRLLPVFKTKDVRGAQYAQVAALNFSTGVTELGWVEIAAGDLKPLETYPEDSALLRQLGDPYLDDFTAAHTDIARFLVRQAQGPPWLLCYVITMRLSMAKLAIYIPSQGKFIPGASLNIPISEMRVGIASIEVRDLMGDGSECVITKQPFREQARTDGVNLCIRRIVDGQFQVLWQAPVAFENLSQYNPRIQILQPPEKNIGAPGTATTGEVTYRPSGQGQAPVWKGKVDFFVIGRDKPVDSVPIEKVCPWNGAEFAPLQ